MSATDPFTPPEPAARLRVPSADGTHLNVEVHGPDGGPAVVLIHGWTCNTSFWAPVLRLLSQAAPRPRVVVYDQRGHGGSDSAPKGAYSVPILVEDLRAVLDATLAAGERAVLAGHSMGAMTIMAAGGDAAVMARTAGAVLCSTGFAELPGSSSVVPGFGRMPRANRVAHRILLGASLPIGPVTPISRAMLKHTALGPKSDKHLQNVNARMIAACPSKPRAAWGRVLSRLDVSEQVALLDVPTSVLFGTKDRLTPAAAHAQAIAAALPRFEGLTTLAGLGHMTPMEDPDTVASLILTRVRAVHEAADVGGARNAFVPHQAGQAASQTVSQTTAEPEALGAPALQDGADR